MICVRAVALACLLAAAAAPAFAQGAMSPREQANLALVSDWWRSVIQAGHVELAAQYMAPDYIQHNPNIDTGRDAFVEIFGRREAGPIPEMLTPAPVVRFAKGDFVVFVWERQGTNPADGSAYPYHFFDVVRVENGVVAEHWDSVFRPVAAPGAAPPAPVEPGLGPRPVAPANTPGEQAIEDVAAAAVLDGADDEPELVLTSGDLVLYMFRRFAEDPAVPDAVYKWNWFDLARVADGRVVEHWDMATHETPPPPAPRPAQFREYRER